MPKNPLPRLALKTNNCIDCQADIKLCSKRCRDCANKKNSEDRQKYYAQVKLTHPESICKECKGKFRNKSGKQRYCTPFCREMAAIRRMMNEWLKK
jgi:hypothetical protein